MTSNNLNAIKINDTAVSADASACNNMMAMAHDPYAMSRPIFIGRVPNFIAMLEKEEDTL